MDKRIEVGGVRYIAWLPYSFNGDGFDWYVEEIRVAQTGEIVEDEAIIESVKIALDEIAAEIQSDISDAAWSHVYDRKTMENGDDLP